jgi:hypothetical protein
MSDAADEFHSRLNGLLFSVMSWQQLTDFWARVDRNGGWYLYAIGEELPESPANNQQVGQFIEKLDALLRHDHHESYCGIVYADNLEQPDFVKIYDPNHLGSSCGSSKNPPLPGWIMSKVPPTELKPKWTLPANRKCWWQALFE